MSERAMARKSETASTKLRGRPRIFPIGEEVAAKAQFGGMVSTTRGLRNKQYAIAAARVLFRGGQRDPRYAWIATDAKMRQAVLVEIGRIAVRFGPDTARAVADSVVARAAAGRFTTTKQAAAWIRNGRLEELDVVRPASSGALQGIVVTAVRGWLAEHPNASSRLVQEALGAAARVLAKDSPKSETVAKNERQPQAPQRRSI
jgi:hypothetical protein